MASKLRFGLPIASLLAAQLVAAGVAGIRAACAQAGPPAARISGDWRFGPRRRIQEAFVPLRPAATDLGPAPSNARLDRVILLLAPSSAQQLALDARLRSIEIPGSPQFHRWLTPTEFAEQYSNSAPDVSQVAAWLSSNGLEDISIPASRGWIEVSGSVAQFEHAFSTTIHLTSSSAGPRFILADSISVPAPLAPIVRGIASLDGAWSSAAIAETAPDPAAEAGLPASGDGLSALTPSALGSLLALDTKRSGDSNGAGESIAIPSRSSIDAQDIAAFRNAFELPPSPLSVVLDGPDPGFRADRAAATLAASWAGAAAPQARILLVPSAATSATDGVELALAAIIDRALARTAAVGYSVCEASLSPAHQNFLAALYRLAAAEGISIVAASGDSGASACTPPGAHGQAQTGFGVNALASTPWNTAVGAAAFSSGGFSIDDPRLSAWSPAAPADPAYAGGGGQSALYAEPGWQISSAPGGQEPGRMLPDLALPTALDGASSPGVAFCFSAGSSSGGCTLYRAGGSSAAAAVFAGVAARLAGRYGAQGNLAPRLYALARAGGVFADIDLGSTRLSCAPQSEGCDASGFIGFSAETGYDMATGLGSIDARALVSRWRDELNGSGAATVNNTIAAGQVINPGGSLVLSGNVVSGTGGPAPTGIVTFYDLTTSTDLADVALTPGAGGASTAAKTITGALGLGAHNIVVDYSGDSVYAGNYSAEVLVEVEASATTVVVSTSSATYAPGAAFIATATIASPNAGAGAPPPTGTVTFTLDGVSQGVAPVVAGAPSTASLTIISPQASGSHQLVAAYSGDANYAASTSVADVIAVSKNPPTVVLTSNLTTVPPGQTLILTATVTPAAAPAAGAEQNPSGAVIFLNGTAVLGTVNLSPSPSGDSSQATLSIQTLAGGADTISAFYQGDAIYGSASSNALAIDIQSVSIAPAPGNPPTNLVIAQGSQGSAAFNVAALGGYSGPVQVVCSVAAQDDMTCTPTPQDVTPPATVTFAVQTFKAGQSTAAASRNMPSRPWRGAGSGAMLAVAVFMLLPFGRRARLFRLGRALGLGALLLVAALGGAGIGCGGGSSQLASFGTPLGVATFTVTASENVNNAVVSQSVYFTVDVTPAGAAE